MSIINNEKLRKLWQTAQKEDEWATTRLWEYIFKTLVFKDSDWAISSQQPPTLPDLRRVDIVIEKWGTNHEWAPFLFVEAKLARATPGHIVDVEHQAFNASTDYVNTHKVKRVCSMTCYGGRAKLWCYEEGQDYLTPFVPPTGGLAAREEYIEVNSPEGKQIIDGLKYIRDSRVPPGSTLTSTSSPPRQGGGSSSSSRKVPTGQQATISAYNVGGFVDTWVEKQQVYFYADRDKIETRWDDWKPGETLYNNAMMPCCVYEHQGRVYYTWELGNLDQDPEAKGKGRQRRH